MALDDVVNGEEKAGEAIKRFARENNRFSQIEEKARKGEEVDFNRSDIQLAFDYNDMPYTLPEIGLISVQPVADKYRAVLPLIPKAKEKSEAGLLNLVKDNYGEIIDQLKAGSTNQPGKLVNLLFGAPVPKDIPQEFEDVRDALGDFNEWKQIAEKGDISGYIDKIDNPVLKSILPYATQEQITELAKARVQIAQSKVIRSIISKDEKTWDEAKLKGYLKAVENTEEDKFELYLATGEFYARSNQE
jgi:hypothetical protein